MAGMADVPGAAGREMAAGVAYLDPAPAVFEAMLAGWERQQRTRFLSDGGTVGPRVAMVRRLAGFTGQYPWQWQPADGEAFICHLRSPGRGHPVVVSTARGYEGALALFMEYVTDPRYGWPAVCGERFGEGPQQIFHEGNTVHASDFEGQPGRRPFTHEEVQALFDAADARVEEIRGRGRKGVLTGMRDAALLKTVYAFGLRRGEACGLDLADFRHNPKVAQFGRFGGLFVRYGKASRGGPPRRRTVLAVPEMGWITEVLRHWVEEVRPCLAPESHPAVWVTERRGASRSGRPARRSRRRGRRPACPPSSTCTACGTLSPLSCRVAISR